MQDLYQIILHEGFRDPTAYGRVGFETLQLNTKLPAKTLKRQLGILISARVVEPQESTGAGYCLSTRKDPLLEALVKCL